MNYYQPRQRSSDQRWHYTSMIDGRIKPIGYCGQESSPCHAAGHATAVEAAQCHKNWVLDTALVLDGRMVNQQLKCRVCEAWTQGFAQIRGEGPLFVLCDTHRTREHVSELMGVPQTRISTL